VVWAGFDDSETMTGLEAEAELDGVDDEEELAAELSFVGCFWAGLDSRRE